MNNVCPKCKAPLQENAQFCPHCMTVLVKKQKIQSPKRKIGFKKRIAVAVAAVLTVAALSVTGAVLFNNKSEEKTSPICSVKQFKNAVAVAGEKNGTDKLFKADGFVDINTFPKENITQYTTDTYLDNAYLSVFFYNEGEEIYAYFCDVGQDDFDNAEKIMKCIVQSVCNNYFTDLDEVFDNEKLHPKSSLEEPFLSGFTDLLMRTEQYNNDIADGAKISSRCIKITDGKCYIYYTITEREMNGKTLYDLAVEIEKV